MFEPIFHSNGFFEIQSTRGSVDAWIMTDTPMEVEL